MESLESRQLLTAACPVISGYVFLDANNNGLFDSGETPLANSTLQLRNSSNVVIGTTTSNASGFYQFSSDHSLSTAQKTMVQTLSFPSPAAAFANHTDWTDTQLINQFDPDLGTLTEVDIQYSGSMQTQIKVENTSTSSGNTINSSVTGNSRITGQSIGTSVALASIADSHNDTFGIFDNTPADQSSPFGADFAGTSGTSHSPITSAPATGAVAVTSSSALASFIGTGTLPYSMDATATSHATDSAGNFASDIETTATGSVTVTYKYIPRNCIANGNYTIVQTVEPPNVTDGKDSHRVNGVQTVIPNSNTTDLIPVIINNADNYQNDFGELSPTVSIPLTSTQTEPSCFWHSKCGQSLINALGATTTTLGNWLATTFPNVYGSTAGANSFAGKSRSYIASRFLTLSNSSSTKLDAQLLSLELAVFTGTSSLNTTSAGQALAKKFLFPVTDASSPSNLANINYNVGSNGPAFGISNNTSLTIGQLLQKTNSFAVNGVLYPNSIKVNNTTYTSSALRNFANTLFNAINNA